MKRQRRVRMLWTWCLAAIALLVGGMALAEFPPLSGPEFPPGDVGAIGDSIGNQEDVDIAAGGSGFLVVWTDMRTSYNNFQGLDQNGRDVYAALLDANGAMIGTTPIIISQDVGSQQEPEVAWNGQNWLVIWEHEVSSGNGTAATKMVYGARVAPDGTLLDTPSAIVEAPQVAGNMTVMEVVANGSDWLVAGQADTGGGLRGVRVAADGTVLDTTPVLLAPGTGTQYGSVTIVSAQGEYLLVADEGGGIGFRGRRFTADLTPRGSLISLPGAPTRIASNGTEYYVTWDPIGGMLRGSRMTLDGTMLDPGGIALMESMYWDGDDSRVTWDGSFWWVFHWIPYPDGGLHFVRVAADGTLVDSTPVY
ncbi:MAG: hypothetical protein OEM96_11195, partial [Gemmatimonadota bacterium]|nr:hypothetical protein [Gemmatimonadota bacterium]